MVSYEKVLPIGSVVLLKGANKRVMILGYQRNAAADPNRYYDYCGCPYPEGYTSPERTAIFDHDQIDRIISMGLQNVDQIVFAEQLLEAIDKMKGQA